MRVVRLSLVVTILFVLPLTAHQTSVPTVQRDAQALAVISKTLNEAGGASALAAIQDFTASGTLNYTWGDSPVQTNATVKGRGLAQFRLDATLPEGGRSVVINNGTGSLKDVDGTITRMPYYQAVNFGSSVLFPIAHLFAAIRDNSVTIVYQGLVTRDGHQVHDIRIEGLSSPAAASGHTPAKLAAQDFFIDSTTWQIFGALGKAYAKDGSLRSTSSEIRFSDYRQINGILVPFSVTTRTAGQRTSTIQLNQITFNNNLSDSDFE